MDRQTIQVDEVPDLAGEAEIGARMVAVRSRILEVAAVERPTVLHRAAAAGGRAVRSGTPSLIQCRPIHMQSERRAREALPAQLLMADPAPLGISSSRHSSTKAQKTF